MTNSENQKIRDKEKWFKSQESGYDRAGSMDWCKVCEFSTNCQTSKSGKRCDYGGTTADFDKVPYPCATAYNRMKRQGYSRSKSNSPEGVVKRGLKLINN